MFHFEELLLWTHTIVNMIIQRMHTNIKNFAFYRNSNGNGSTRKSCLSYCTHRLRECFYRKKAANTYKPITCHKSWYNFKGNCMG